MPINPLLGSNSGLAADDDLGPRPPSLEPPALPVSAEPNSWPPIGELFVQRGYVTAEQLEEALDEQHRTGERVGEILVKHGWISRVDLAGALSTQWSWTREQEQLQASSPPPLASVSVLPVPTVTPGRVETAPSLEELSQVCANLTARVEAQSREIDDLRRQVAEQAGRIRTAGSALLA